MQLKWYAARELEKASVTNEKEVGLKIMIYFKCECLALPWDLLRWHEPEVSVDADTGLLRNVSQADTVWHQEEWDW